MHAGALVQADQEALEAAHRRLHVAHRKALAQFGQAGGIGDRHIHAAELIDQSAVQRLLAGPHAALRNCVDVGVALAARLRHLPDEVAIALVDDRLDHRADLGVERAGDVERACHRPGADAVALDAELGQGVGHRVVHAEDADRAGDGVRLGDDAVGIHRYPVTAAGGHVAHRHHHRDAGCAGQLHLATDLLGGEHLAAGGIDPQHQRPGLAVLACRADQGGGGFAADRTGRLPAAGDLALGHHHRHAGREQVALARHPGDVAGQTHLADAVALRIGRHTFLAQHRDQLGAGGQTIDQMLVQRQLREVALGAGDGLRQVVDVGAQRGGIQLAQRGHFAEVAVPQPVHPVAVGLLGGRRGVVENVGLGRTLELADTEQVHVDAELVQQVLVEQPVVGQPGDHHAALRIDQHPIGMRRQVVLALIQVDRPRDHRLARSAEAIQRRAHLAQRGKAAALQVARQQQDARDALVLRRGVDRADQIAQLHLLRRVARQPGHRPLQRINAVLLDQLALRLEHQHAVVLQRALHPVAGDAADDHQQQQKQQAEKHQVDDHQPGDIDAAPERAQKAAETTRARRQGTGWQRWRHAGSSGGVGQA